MGADRLRTGALCVAHPIAAHPALSSTLVTTAANPSQGPRTESPQPPTGAREPPGCSRPLDSPDGLAKNVDGLLDGGGGRLCRAQGVEHHEVVDDRFVADGRSRDTRLDQTPGVGLSLIAEHVVLVHDHKGWREADELIERGAQR